MVSSKFKIKEPPLTLTVLGNRCRDLYEKINKLVERIEKMPQDNEDLLQELNFIMRKFTIFFIKDFFFINTRALTA